jgi:hypothetical protein
MPHSSSKSALGLVETGLAPTTALASAVVVAYPFGLASVPFPQPPIGRMPRCWRRPYCLSQEVEGGVARLCQLPLTAARNQPLGWWRLVWPQQPHWLRQWLCPKCLWRSYQRQGGRLDNILVPSAAVQGPLANAARPRAGAVNDDDDPQFFLLIWIHHIKLVLKKLSFFFLHP